MECRGPFACQKQQVSASDVTCVDAFSCYATFITCPDGVDEVAVECAEQYSCYGATLAGSCEFDVDCEDGFHCPQEAGSSAKALPPPPLNGEQYLHRGPGARIGHKNVAMMSSPLVFGILAVLIVLLTVNATCLFMKRRREKEQNMGF